MTEHISDRNNIRPLIKWELVWLVIQFLVLISAIIYSYATTQSRLDVMGNILEQHIAQHNQYLRTDVWEVRNKFIDEKLSRIEQKVDIILQEARTDSERKKVR